MSITRFFFQQVASGAWRRGDTATFDLGIKGMELVDSIQDIHDSAMYCGARSAKEHVAAQQSRDSEINRLTKDAAEVKAAAGDAWMTGEVLHDGKGLAQPWLTLGLPWETAHG
jgi:hypothetical protein